MREVNDLSPEQRQELLIWQRRLQDHTRTPAEHAEASSEIMRLLHTGPFGEVFEAVDEALDRVAVVEEALRTTCELMEQVQSLNLDTIKATVDALADVVRVPEGSELAQYIRDEVDSVIHSLASQAVANAINDHMGEGTVTDTDV